MVIVLSAPGGVGKGTVADRLLAIDPNLRLSRSWTTRERRPGEDPDAYVFVDRASFVDHLEGGGFRAHDDFLGNLSGPPVPPTADHDRDPRL